jgi:hypothetical protein
MGIPGQLARLILREHRFKPLTGTLLSVGRQTVYLTPDQAIAMVKSELDYCRDVRIEIDETTRNADRGRFITDRSFYALFSDVRYQALDQSDFEGADISFDLCQSTLPQNLAGRFDFVFDGSVLDNVFDAAAALRNMVRMTAPTGRVMHVNRTSRRHNVYLTFAPSWFYDYYSINGFADCQVYLAQWDGDQVRSRWDLYHFQPVRELPEGGYALGDREGYYFPWRHAHAIVIAEKSATATVDRNPMQREYRLASDSAYLDAAMRFFKSSRPCLLHADERRRDLPREFFQYAEEVAYCGSIEPAA